MKEERERRKRDNTAIDDDAQIISFLVKVFLVYSLTHNLNQRRWRKK